jgi:hypothetical protein
MVKSIHWVQMLFYEMRRTRADEGEEYGWLLHSALTRVSEHVMYQEDHR